MPKPNSSCSRMAVRGRKASLSIDIARLRHSCTPPRIMPIVPSSKTSVAPVSMTPSAKMTSRSGVPSISGTCAWKASAMSGKAKPRMSEPTADVISEAENSPPRSRRFGSSPIIIVPRPNMPTVPSRAIALVAAAP